MITKNNLLINEYYLLEIERLLEKVGRTHFVKNYSTYKYNPWFIKRLDKEDKLNRYYGALLFDKNLNLYALYNIIKDDKTPIDIKEKARILLNNNYRKIDLSVSDLVKKYENNKVDLLKLYSGLLKELRKREIVKSNNLKNDISRFYILERYNPRIFTSINFHLNNTGRKEYNDGYFTSDTYCQNPVTAIFRNVVGNKTKKITNVSNYNDKYFDYLIITKLSDDYELDYLLELTWDDFFKEKKLIENDSYYIEVDDRLISKYLK